MTSHRMFPLVSPARLLAVSLSTAALVMGGATVASAIDAEVADAMLAPQHYVTTVHTGIAQNWWRGQMINTGSASYPAYKAALQTPGAKLMVIVQFKSNPWYHQFKIFGGDNTLLMDQYSGDPDSVTGERVLYTAQGALVMGNPCSTDEGVYHYYLIDLPDLEALGGNIQTEGNWSSTEATGWNTVAIDMFVAVPATGHIWEMRFVEYPTVLPLGESAPLRAALVDKLTPGVTNEECTITYGTQDNWYNCHYEDGRLYALASITNLGITASTTLKEEGEEEGTTYSASVNVTVPMLKLERYVEKAHWDLATVVRSWWTEESRDLCAEMAPYLNKPMVAVKISYTQQAAGNSWNQGLVRVNWDDLRFWHLGPPGQNYPEGSEQEAVGFFADGFDHINQWIYNMNDCVIDRITVYWPVIGTSVLVR